MSTAPESPNYADELAEEIADEAYVRAAEPDRATSPDALSELPPDRFLDRQASWLQFNERLLDLASDPEIPLLERARFLAIFATNLDDFFMVRVAGLKRRISGGLTAPEGAVALRERLDRVLATAEELMERQHAIYREVVLPELATQGIEILHWDELKDFDKDILEELFEHSILPVLTPLAVDPAHPFPYISGLSLNLAVVLLDHETRREHFARVKVPPLLPRLVRVEDHRFIALEEVIAAHLPALFSGMEVLETYNFRVTRNEDVELEEEEDVEDLLTALERELVRRRFGPPVRLEVEEGISERVLSLLVRELRVNENEVFRLPPPVNLGALFEIADVDRPDLKYRSFGLRPHPRLASREGSDRPDVFAEVAARDLLVHHPYDSFASSVQAFIEQAAADPNVLAIKQTLYRTSGDSPIVEALIDAAGAGKQVLVLVEIKARFDEQANIRWARALEQAGCHVVYGLVGLKTHCKLSLVVRQERDGLRRYAHIGTGNYNPKTARIYEDFGLLTADPSICDDVADLFNHLSGYTKHKDYENLLVAPDTLRSGIRRLIEEQTARAEQGLPSRIRMKVNSLVDDRKIDALYAASQAGVPIDLVVRGMCSLRPGVPGLSETIRVRSILGRFLEHSRILHFGPPGEDTIWIGSADIMLRNLDRRVEAMVQVKDEEARKRLCEVLELALSPEVAAWELQGDGTWTRRARDEQDNRLADYQELLIGRALGTAGGTGERP